MTDPTTRLLVHAVARLRLERDELDAALRAHRRQLVDALGPSARLTVDGWRVQTTRRRRVLAIPEPDRVPAAFRVPRPDRRAILAAWIRGEAVPGTHLGHAPPSLCLRAAEDA